ncbi:MAG: type II toxin-antitoxin system PemK/MazF family toxin, partial [Rhodococcus sp. (in: high G+C Gram-positive bacteria)]|nr:type II toxin-antitoxin system PemK/MazF family toxin [Rhodococcus sp. (in: high G+C Gram-positive bacteria)]
MASQWKAFQKFAENIVFNEAPKLIRQLPKPERVIQQGLRIGMEALAGQAAPTPVALTTGRP